MTDGERNWPITGVCGRDPGGGRNSCGRARLREELPSHGFGELTPTDALGPYIVFSYPGARDRYNEGRDIDRLLRILCALTVSGSAARFAKAYLGPILERLIH
jgi:hypothetical protein